MLILLSSCAACRLCTAKVQVQEINGYFCIKQGSGHTNPLCGCTQIITAFGGGGGNWSFVSPAGSLQSRDLTRLRSLRSFNSLKTLHCNVFRTWLDAKCKFVFHCRLVEAAGIEPASENIATRTSTSLVCFRFSLIPTRQTRSK
jgi:hypothetical protein